MIGASKTEPQQLEQLLLAALRQMNEYARQLNAIDGGDRKEFKDIETWKMNASK
jgi:hypothetical protein